MNGWTDVEEADQAFVLAALRHAAGEEQAASSAHTDRLDKADAQRRCSALLAAADHLTPRAGRDPYLAHRDA